MRVTRSYFVALVVGAVLAAPARSQPPGGAPGAFGPGPVARPAFSPYLNLLRGNTNPALNYYGIVRPQLQAQAAIQSLQAQVLYPPTLIPGAGADQQLTTGNAVGFQNYRGYFQNQFSGGAFGAGGIGAGGGRTGAPSGGAPATGMGRPPSGGAPATGMGRPPTAAPRR